MKNMFRSVRRQSVRVGVALALSSGAFVGGASAQFGVSEYAAVRGWIVEANWQGPSLAYCSATIANRGYHLRIGFDGGDWVVGGEATGNSVPGRIGIDGYVENVTFNGFGDGWVFTRFSRDGAGVLRNGSQLVLGIGGPDVVFSLSGSAAAMLKVDECFQRGGHPPAPVGQQAAAPTSPGLFGQQAPAPAQQASRCAAGEYPLAVTGLCPTEAIDYLLSGRSRAEPLPGCTWTVNETEMPGNEVLIYQAANCGGEVGWLEFAGGAHFATLTVPGGGVEITVGSADPANPEGNILAYAREAMDDPWALANCYVQPYQGEDVYGAYVVDVDPAVAASSDGPYGGMCGRFGVTDQQSYWRVFGGMSWFIEMGQDAWHEVDPATLTLLEPAGAGQWRVRY